MTLWVANILFNTLQISKYFSLYHVIIREFTSSTGQPFSEMGFYLRGDITVRRVRTRTLMLNKVTESVWLAEGVSRLLQNRTPGYRDICYLHILIWPAQRNTESLGLPC